MKRSNRNRQKNNVEYKEARDKFVKLFWNISEESGNPSIRDYLAVLILEVREIRELLGPIKENE